MSNPTDELDLAGFTAEEISNSARTFRDALEGGAPSALADVCAATAEALEAEYLLGDGRGWATLDLDLPDRRTGELLAAVSALSRLAEKWQRGTCDRVVVLIVAGRLLALAGEQMKTTRALETALSL